MDMIPPENPWSLDALSITALAHSGGAGAALAYLAEYARANGASLHRLSLRPKGRSSLCVMFDLDMPAGGNPLDVGQG